MSLVIALALLAPLQNPTQANPVQTKPPQTDPVQARLASSPRHHEWVEVASGARKVRCFVVFPEVKAKVPAVLVIHENKGLSDWVRSVADRLAEEGFVALAPDLLSGHGPEGGNTDAFASTDAATEVLYALAPAQVLADLDAVAAHARTLPAVNGTVSVAGFCWGGGKAFEYATHAQDLAAAYVFYGSAPEAEKLATIACPVHGFYGENDARINAGLDATAAAMKAAGKVFEPVIYPGAGHGFLRAGEAADASKENAQARAEAWKRWVELLKR